MPSPPPPDGCHHGAAIGSRIPPGTTAGAPRHPRPISLAQRRRLPPPCRWVDPRLVRDPSREQRRPQAWALSLVLVTVADAQGLSSSAAPSLGPRCSLTGTALSQARQARSPRGLVASQPPRAPVFALDAAPSGATPRTARGVADADPVDIQAVLARLWEVLA